ncbi:hypothetical protein E0485_01860 [Paenibacillus albiflavus]|uniref:DUF3829 domain-containing protein n=1 Tax=Paenibacillus albiflavus TaxID=2545760 RepID=A0A4R4EQZ0_9BACL|nr:hypothetical protein [Paenibacillus albiflavus]TCZ81051.1 hypothetical protein E0485_01860 [Paenibacillus albiflavus]
MRMFIKILLLTLVIALSACSNSSDIVKKSEENIKDSSLPMETKVPESSSDSKEFEQLMGMTVLQGVRSYFEYEQGTVPLELRKQMTGLITKATTTFPNGNKEKFIKLGEHIEKDSFENARTAFLELADIYGLQVVESEVKKQVKESIKTDVPNISNLIADLDPTKVEATIKENAEAKWVGDYDMQAYEIKKQTEAYKKLVKFNLDTDAKKISLDKAHKKWKSDFDMIIYEYEKQMNAFADIQALNADSSDMKKILDRAFEKWGDDYNMVLYEYKKQLKAYESLKKK